MLKNSLKKTIKNDKKPDFHKKWRCARLHGPLRGHVPDIDAPKKRMSWGNSWQILIFNVNVPISVKARSGDTDGYTRLKTILELPPIKSLKNGTAAVIVTVNSRQYSH